MRRRTFLTGTSLGAFSGSGCLSALGSECPDPDIENEVSYESRDPDGELFLNSKKEGVFSVTRSDEVDRFDAHSFDREDRRWVRETDFEEAIVLGIQARASEESGPLQVRGVGEEFGDTIHVYTCIERAGETRHWKPYTRLLRIPYDGELPHTAKLTHWRDGDEHTFVESCEIACFDFTHIGADDVPDKLTIDHVRGRTLPADEVFITNVVVEHGRTTEWVIDTVAWHEVTDDTGPSDRVARQSVRVDIEFPDVVEVLWRHDGGEQVLDETRAFR